MGTEISWGEKRRFRAEQTSTAGIRVQILASTHLGLVGRDQRVYDARRRAKGPGRGLPGPPGTWLS